jgi:phosphoesterase RecJ-like protein
VRDRIGNPETAGLRKVSLRSGSDGIDVSVIARAQGGGGHKQAAGFSTALSHDELVRFLRAQLAAQL